MLQLNRPTNERCLMAGFVQEIHAQALNMLEQLMLL